MILLTCFFSVQFIKKYGVGDFKEDALLPKEMEGRFGGEIEIETCAYDERVRTV